MIIKHTPQFRTKSCLRIKYKFPSIEYETSSCTDLPLSTPHTHFTTLLKVP